MISLVLLPSEDDSQHITAFSRRLTDSRFSLGSEALPHVTVALYDASAEEAEALWDDIQKLVDKPFELTSGGLGFVLGKSGGHVWTELQFLCSIPLLQLQSDVLATDFGQSHQALNAVAEAYRPHCTIGLLEGESSAAVLLNEAPIFQREFKDMRLAVGVNGEFFALEKILFVQNA